VTSGGWILVLLALSAAVPFLRRLLGPASPTTAADARHAWGAPGARALVALQFALIGLLYIGVAIAVFSTEPVGGWLLASQRALGAGLILAGIGFRAWAMTAFRSWRLLARIDAGHELCTKGPYAWVRHPIYLGLDLLVLGATLWVPTPLVAISALLVILVQELRARAEERILAQAFGDEYRRYAARVKRWVPGVY